MTIAQSSRAQASIAIGEQHEVYVPATENRTDIKTVIVRKPWDLRLVTWVGDQIVTPRRTVRLIYWVAGFPARWYRMARLFLVAVTGPRVSVETKRERDETCWSCPDLVGEPRTKRTYCASCGCPDWYFSRVSVGNWFERRRCAEKRHPGVYPEYPGGGCSGCGTAQDHWPAKPRRASTGGTNHGSG